MKPSSKLLRPVPVSQPTPQKPRVAHEVPSERDALVMKRVAAVADVAKLEKAIKTGTARRVADTFDAYRKETDGRPPAVAGAVAIRVMGASCDDKSPVGLPNLRVMIATEEGAHETVTDVTGLAVLPLPRRDDEVVEKGETKGETKGEPKKVDPKLEQAPRAMVEQRAASAPKGTYRLRVMASDGSKVADVEPEASRTHLVHLGDTKALEGHAVLGRGWMSALDKAAKRGAKAAKEADALLEQHLCRARDRVTAIDRRLELLTKKKA
jgi:hypothetical protein